ncbi:hypothetical protein C0V82_12120 [Niveispirillum cyanobacteriorum]|uniref:Uncharacterized protein n=1 Tax=Niveispirillum cyanobacteriorum TaxID=1612173 RepID=A0A2K9NCN1_9PROT|nr:hypothetical protein C0V82_12120 [Niveispirillum cyanobacteriorum]GGE80663.1 hypothetical protein GCM10011317_42300 [Niveispirillum cyanobacteriorum]
MIWADDGIDPINISQHINTGTEWRGLSQNCNPDLWVGVVILMQRGAAATDGGHGTLSGAALVRAATCPYGPPRLSRHLSKRQGRPT